MKDLFNSWWVIPTIEALSTVMLSMYLKIQLVQPAITRSSDWFHNIYVQILHLNKLNLLNLYNNDSFNRLCQIL